MTTSAQQKIKGQHLERLALIYLRQSSPRQVRVNFRSTERQYGLSEEVTRLGWAPEQIVAVDGDLGVSGRDVDARESYKELVARVCKSEVGAIVVMCVLFGLAHAPGLYFRAGRTLEAVGTSPSWLMALGYSIVVTSVAGFFLGVLWARTQNLLLVMAIHAAGDLIPNLAPIVKAWL